MKDPLYKVGITIRENAINRSYTMTFNGTNRSITLPNTGDRMAYEHSTLILRSYGVRVTNIVLNENGDYVLVIPMKYWNNVRELFVKASR